MTGCPGFHLVLSRMEAGAEVTFAVVDRPGDLTHPFEVQKRAGTHSGTVARFPTVTEAEDAAQRYAAYYEDAETAIEVGTVAPCGGLLRLVEAAQRPMILERARQLALEMEAAQCQ